MSGPATTPEVAIVAESPKSVGTQPETVESLELSHELDGIQSTTTSMAISVAILATFSVVAALYFARAFFVPLLIGILASYALRPLVDWLKAKHIPEPLGAAIVLAALITATCWGLVSLGDDAAAMVEKLPEAARKVRMAVAKSAENGPTTIQKIQEAATDIQGTAAAVTGGAPLLVAPDLPSTSATVVAKLGDAAKLRSPPVSVAVNKGAAARSVSPPAAAPSAPQSPPSAWLRDYLLVQSALLFTVASQTPIVILLTYFLLASGNHFRRKMVHLVGPSFSRKKDTVRVLDEINVQIQRYLLATLGANVLVGVSTWLLFEALGVEQAGAWGIAAGVLHFIPYFGSAVFTVVSATAAFLQFGTLTDALIVGGSALVVATIIGSVIMTWLQSRFAKLNAAALFISLLFFGWLWGIWGLLLGAPLVAIAKVVCDRVDALKPMGEFLGQ